ncbi:metal ABC transporter ATP-binding protein [Patescibacteria group bacterium]
MIKDEVLLSVSGLNVSFDGNKVLRDVNFEIKRDDTVAVIGPNGAGKTVLFRALLGLIPFTGEVKWAKGVKVGYVPQKLAIAADIPLTTMEFFKLKENKEEEIKKSLSSVGLKEHVLDKKVGVLSGGELQRVLIAFALLRKPDVLLFDEPTAGADMAAEETIYSLLRKLQKEEDLTIFLISHEVQVLYKYANHIICLNREKVYFGPPGEILDRKILTKIYGEDVDIFHHNHNGD